MNENQRESKRALVNNLCPKLRVSEKEVQNLFETLDRLGSFDAPVGEISVAFVSKTEIARLHREFMNDPSATDVITFPGDTEEGLAGDICVCPEVADSYAAKENLEFSDELSLYLVHGYLHLSGFDDIAQSDRAEMRKAENIAMSLLRNANALPRFALND